jgi:hypothetical protein
MPYRPRPNKRRTELPSWAHDGKLDPFLAYARLRQAMWASRALPEEDITFLRGLIVANPGYAWLEDRLGDYLDALEAAED